LPILFIGLFLGFTFIPPMFGMYSPTFSSFYGILPEQGRSGNAPQLSPTHTITYVGGTAYSMITNKPLVDLVVRMYGMDDGRACIVHTDVKGFFNSTEMFASGQMLTLSFNNTYAGSIFIPYGVSGYYDIGIINLNL
jgi:hypothetical protein